MTCKHKTWRAVGEKLKTKSKESKSDQMYYLNEYERLLIVEMTRAALDGMVFSLFSKCAKCGEDIDE